MPFVRLKPARYADGLRAATRRSDPGRLIDLLLCGALIEARSYERFVGLAPRLQAPLGEFYGGLAASEARHYTVYVRLAEQRAGRAGLARTPEALGRDRSGAGYVARLTAPLPFRAASVGRNSMAGATRRRDAASQALQIAQQDNDSTRRACERDLNTPIRDVSRATEPMGASSCHLLRGGNRRHGGCRKDIDPPVRPAVAITAAYAIDDDEEPAVADRNVRRLCDCGASHRAARRE